MKKTVFLVFLLPIILFAQNERIKVTGEYSYTYGDNESLLEAKSLCYTMALRNAIESLTVFVQSTATVDNYQLKNDLIQTIASGYIDELKTIEEKVEGRNVHYKISGYVNPNAVKNVIQNRVGKSLGNRPTSIDNNGYLEILNVRSSDYLIKVTYKVLQNTGQIFLRENENPQFRIMIDYYDSEGDIIGGDYKFVHDDLVEMVTGQVGMLAFNKPSDAISYRVWLFKGR